MARNLLNAGVDRLAFDKRPEAMASLVSGGAVDLAVAPERLREALETR